MNDNSLLFLIVCATILLLIIVAIIISSNKANKKRAYIQSIKKHIDDNYSFQSFTVDALCDMMHLSHSYICRIFSTSEGCTIINYIENVRLRKACKLLTDTSLNVSHISSMVGYSDPLHFMKSFKKKFGITALEYRRRNT